ncbi:hypothetical protein UFVDC4_00146 [Staphylococcus phage vB_SauM-UFV_DC4]|nr:hypothetical protein UFVDC4_00146 [Staphylococcus phage vB_SauM-UFV_DC4]
MLDILLYSFSGVAIVGGSAMAIYNGNKLITKKKRVSQNELKLKDTEELIDLNETKIMEKLNDSYKLENTFDGKERYYALHYLLSHPEMEFYKEIATHIYSAVLNGKNNVGAEYTKDLFIEGKSYNKRLDLLTFSLLYKKDDKFKINKENGIMEEFKDLLDTNIEDLERLERKGFMYTKDDSSVFYKYSFLGTKILIGLIDLHGDYYITIIDEKENVYIKDMKIGDEIDALQYFDGARFLYHPLDFYILDDGELQILDPNSYNLNTSENKKIIFDFKSYNSEPIGDKRVNLYFEDIEVEKVPFNTEGLLNYLNNDVKRENDDFIYLKGNKEERNIDKNHWSNLIETNYMMNYRDKKKFMKNIHNKLVEEKRMKDIEEYKNYSEIGRKE